MSPKTQAKHLKRLLEEILMINQILLEFHDLPILEIVNKDIKKVFKRIEQK